MQRMGDCINMNEIRITPTPQYAGFGYELRIFDIENQRFSYAENIQMKSISEENEGIMIDPVMTLTKDEVQKWLDELWALGIRPSNGEGNIGEIGAVKYHLEDMRKLVFKEKN